MIYNRFNKTIDISNSRFMKIKEILGKNDMGCSSMDIDFFNNLEDNELDDTVKVSEIINQINDYEEYCERDKKYSNYIYEIVRQSLGRDKYDFSIDERIDGMNSDEVLESVCSWNGLINFNTAIKEWITDIYGVSLSNKSDIETELGR